MSKYFIDLCEGRVDFSSFDSFYDVYLYFIWLPPQAEANLTLSYFLWLMIGYGLYTLKSFIISGSYEYLGMNNPYSVDMYHHVPWHIIRSFVDVLIVIELDLDNPKYTKYDILCFFIYASYCVILGKIFGYQLIDLKLFLFSDYIGIISLIIFLTFFSLLHLRRSSINFSINKVFSLNLIYVFVLKLDATQWSKSHNLTEINCLDFLHLNDSIFFIMLIFFFVYILNLNKKIIKIKI